MVQLVKMFPDADGILFVTMDYEFESRAMSFAAGGVAYLNMFFYDKECGKIFRIRERNIKSQRSCRCRDTDFECKENSAVMGRCNGTVV